MKLIRKRNPKRKGFTLIELLIVILVLAILMAVALPLYLGAVSDSQLKTCRANMQTIANAEQAYKTSSSTHTYTTDLTALNANLGTTPICPNQGTYSISLAGGTSNNGKTVPAGNVIIQCSYVDPADSTKKHGVFAPGFDSE